MLSPEPELHRPEQAGKTAQVFIKYYSDTTALALAVKNGEVDVAWRSLAPTDIANLKSDSNVTVATGKGSEIRYWVWKVDGPVGKQLAIRQAAAQLIDRQAIAKNAYDGTVDPLYSIVPPGYGGAKNSFKTAYGSPDPAKAKQILQAGRHADPGQPHGGLDAHALRSQHRGRGERARSASSNSSGLFKVTLKSTEWEQYQTIYKQGAYDLFILGWFPDYPDGDDYLSPVHGRRWLLRQRVHRTRRSTSWSPRSRAPATRPSARRSSGSCRTSPPTTSRSSPRGSGRTPAVYGKGMTGVESTLDPSFIFRFWLVTKS